MSESQQHSEPNEPEVLLSALGWIGVIFIFFLIVAVAYLPNRAVSQEEKNAGERYTLRNEVRGEQARLVGSYEWVNEQEGVVRIPVERAMKLAVEEMRAEQDASPGPSR